MEPVEHILRSNPWVEISGRIYSRLDARAVGHVWNRSFEKVWVSVTSSIFTPVHENMYFFGKQQAT